MWMFLLAFAVLWFIIRLSVMVWIFNAEERISSWSDSLLDPRAIVC